MIRISYRHETKPENLPHSNLCDSAVLDGVWLCREHYQMLAQKGLLKRQSTLTGRKIQPIGLKEIIRFHLHLPPSAPSDDSSSLLVSSPRFGAFLVQYCPSFCRAGATNQCLTGTSMMHSHKTGSAEHRRPSSRSITCVILRKENSATEFSSCFYIQ